MMIGGQDNLSGILFRKPSTQFTGTLVLTDRNIQMTIPASVSLLSGDGKPPVESLISALKILLASMILVKPASYRLRGKGLTNIIDTSIYHLSRIKLVQFAGIVVLLARIFNNTLN